jgi:hypothetical protein
MGLIFFFSTFLFIQIVSLDNCLLRLLEMPPDSSPRFIDAALQSFGYPRHWASSVRERLYAISFLVLMRNIWVSRLALRISEHSASSLPNLSCLWSRHLFPLSSKPLPSRVTTSRSHNFTRDTCVQSYGRIIQKIKLLKSLERCRTHLLNKITTKLSLLHSKEGSQSPSKRITIPPDQQLLDHCTGFIMPQSMRGSTQEGSLRKLREETATAEEMTQNSLKFQSLVVKYFDWIGEVDPSPRKAPTSFALTSDTEERDFHEELTKSVDMIASLESVLPLLLLHGKYCFVPSSSSFSSTTSVEEPQRRSRAVSSELCLHELALIAASQLEDLSALGSNDEIAHSSGEMESTPHAHPPLSCPSLEQDKFLELSLASLLFPLPPQTPHPSVGSLCCVLEAGVEGGVGETLDRLRDNHRGVLQKTISATQKYNCPYEFGSLPRRTAEGEN